MRDMEAAVAGSLGQGAAARVRYFSPDDFLDHLRTLPVATRVQTPPADSIVRGYKVRRHAPKLTPEEQKQREALGIQALVDHLRKPARQLAVSCPPTQHSM